MSYDLRQADGSGQIQQSRSVTGYGAPASSIVNHQTTVHNTIGRCVWLRSTAGGGANDGEYSIVQRISGTSSLVSPPLADETVGAGGSAWFLFQGAQKVAPTSLAAATFTAPDAITGIGVVDFDAALVQRNDRVLLAGTASNDGGWFVNVHPTIPGALQVRPVNGAAAMVSEPGLGTIEIRVGTHVVYAINEATPTFAGLFSTGVVHATFGSGVIGDFRVRESRQLLSGDLDVYALLGIGWVQLVLSSGSAAWKILEELVYNANHLGDPISLASAASGPGILNTLELGSDGGGTEPTAASEGSAVIGFFTGADVVQAGAAATNTRWISESYGSYWRSSVFAGLNNAIWRSSLIQGDLAQPGLVGGSGGVAESIISAAPGGAGFYTLGAGLDAANILITESSLPGYVGFPAAPVTFEGLLKSDLAVSPLYQLFGADFIILNPREDYTGTELFDLFSFPAFVSNGYIRYTWNPTFRERDATGALGAEIVGLKVRVWDQSILGVNEISGSPFTTDANGQLNAGAGIDLLRSWSLYFSPSQYDIAFTQRIVVEGENYRAQDYTISMAQKLVYDHPVDVQQTDFEGELSR